MVKSIIYTLVAAALCLGIFLYSNYYVTKQFEEFSAAVEALYSKVEDKTANREDCNAVRTMWSDKRSKLHIFVPHNDISYVDYWISEASGLLYKGNYDEALSKIEVLREISKNLPGAYELRLENIL